MTGLFCMIFILHDSYPSFIIHCVREQAHTSMMNNWLTVEGKMFTKSYFINIRLRIFFLNEFQVPVLKFVRSSLVQELQDRNSGLNVQMKVGNATFNWRMYFHVCSEWSLSKSMLMFFSDERWINYWSFCSGPWSSQWKSRYHSGLDGITLLICRYMQR